MIISLQVSNDEGSYSNPNKYTINIKPSEDTSIDNVLGTEWLVQPVDTTVAQHTPVS